MTWNPLTNSNHVGIDILSLGVYDSVDHFNDGAIASLEILKDMNVEAGERMTKSLVYRMSEPQRKRRKIIRHFRKKLQDKNLNEEGTTYKARGFCE